MMVCLCRLCALASGWRTRAGSTWSSLTHIAPKRVGHKRNFLRHGAVNVHDPSNWTVTMVLAPSNWANLRYNSIQLDV
jgi:hypothetical protein